MRALFTGASSFTGLGLVQALAAAGHEVICPLRGSLESYSGIRRQRAQLLRPLARLEPGASFGSDHFLALMREAGPWDVLCHHGADVTDYKSPSFNPFRALESNCHNLERVLEVFKGCGGKAIILTGTMFEPDEGKGEAPLRAFSPYGLSKGMTWHVFRYYCGRAQVPLAKFVIPNPFGPWEEARFTTYLMNTWKSGKAAQVKTPDYVRDNIHVDLLAAAYLVLVRRVMDPQAATGVARGAEAIRLSPSGYAESNGAFAERVASEVRKRTSWACAVERLRQEDFSEPMMRTNLEPAAALAPGWKERAAWDAFVEYYTRG